MKAFLVALTIILGSIALADDAAVTGMGGAVEMLKGHPTIRMVSEVVRITLPAGDVDARFVFHNEGPATTVVMGFPEEGWSSDLDEGESTGFQRFRTYVDGRRVRVSRVETKPVPEGDYKFWWVKRVHFRKGQTRVVVDRYRGGIGITGGRTHWFTYTLSSGSSWKDTIGRAVLIVDVRGLKRSTICKIGPKGYHEAHGRIAWDFRDFDPDFDINVEWFPGFPDFVVNGRHVMSATLPDNYWWQDDWGQALPRLRRNEAYVPVRAIAAWLGAKLDTTPLGIVARLRMRLLRNSRRRLGQTVRIERGGKWVELRVGSHAMLSSSGSVRLSRAPFDSEDTILVPLAPVVRALGGTAQLDARTKKMVVWIK